MALGIHLFWSTWHGVRLFWRTGQYLKSQYGLPSSIQIYTVEVISPEPFQGTPRIAFSLTLCLFLLPLSCYCIALNLIFPAYTLCATFSNFRSSLQQMDPLPSQVRTHYSQKNQEAHLERALAFKKAANLPWPSNVCHPIICLCALYCGWLLSPISVLNQDDGTDQDIGDDHSDVTRESTWSSDIEGDDVDHQQKVLHLCQACRDKSLRTTSVSLLKIQCYAYSVIAHPPLRNSRNLPVVMIPPLLQREKSSRLNKLSESDCAPSVRTQVLPNKSCGDQNAPWPKASSDYNVQQHQKATFKVVKWFMEAKVFTKTPWPILSYDKYSLVETTWKPAIEAQDRQRAFAGASVGTPSVCQLLTGLSLKIDPQTPDAASLEFYLILLYQTNGYWLPSKIYAVETEDSYHLRTIGSWGKLNCCL